MIPEGREWEMEKGLFFHHFVLFSFKKKKNSIYIQDSSLVKWIFGYFRWGKKTVRRFKEAHGDGFVSSQVGREGAFFWCGLMLLHTHTHTGGFCVFVVMFCGKTGGDILWRFDFDFLCTYAFSLNIFTL